MPETAASGCLHRLYDRRSQTREKTCLILESVNKYLSAGSGGFTALDGAPTIEHIMPQTLDASWKKMLGSDGDRVYRECLHTLGNLTLVTQEWNSTLSNAPFAAKKERLARHALKINSTYFVAESYPAGTRGDPPACRVLGAEHH